jgi:glycosyltransferase involved in cell wall biosynthesis
MRVTMLFAEGDGGVAEHVRVLATGLSAQGHRVDLFGPPDAIVRPALESVVSSYEPVPLVGTAFAPLRDIRALVRVLQSIRATRPDVLHGHGQKGGIVARIAGLLSRTPVVYSPHGFGYRNQLLRPRRGARVRRWLVLQLERVLGRMTTAVVACSSDEAAAAVADRVARPARVLVVRYGIAPDLGAPPDQRLIEFAGGAPLFGCVATLREQKGLDHLVDAIARVARDAGSTRFAIVGNGPLRSHFEDRIRREDLSAHVLMAPFDGAVEPYLRALDCFVLASLWEGLPIAVLEAMAFGLPVIATRVNGVPEAVADGQTGLLVPSRDPDALAAAIKRLGSDADLRQRMGDAGRNVVAERFTVPRMLGEMTSVYDGALGRGSS